MTGRQLPAVALIYNGLFVPADRRGIYWLRLYRRGNQGHVATLTEVPGNPGMSVTNASSLLAIEVSEAFSIDSTTLEIFIVWPRLEYLGGEVQPATYSHAPGHSNSRWRQSTRKAIEGIVGTLPEMPAHAELFAEVMARGGRSHEWSLEIFEAVPVLSLPPFHGAYQCVHRARFESLEEAIQTPGRGLSHQEELEVGRRFLASLTPMDRAVCPYHDGDWRLVADASVEILRRVDGRVPGAYVAAAEKTRLRRREKRWLESLFTNPIDVGRNLRSYTNGQHRGCALRFSGAEKVAVLVDLERKVDPNAEWIYLGEG